MPNSPPPELRLLRALLQGRPETPPRGADTNRFADLVDFHRSALRLEAPACQALSADLQTMLAARRRAALADAMARTGELYRLARAFNVGGMPWLTFKGPAFGQLLHGRTDRRSCRDLDFLVPEEAEPAARALLAEAGYDGPPREPGIRQSELRHADGGRLVDLHVGMIDDDPLFPERLFQPFHRVVRVDIGGEPIPTLGLEAALVFAAYHGGKHFWRRLFMVQDFADAARSDRVDWDAALDLARRLGCERSLALALVLAERWLGAPTPAPLTARPRLYQVGESASAPLDDLSDLPTPVLDVDAYRRIGPWRVLCWRLRLHQRPAARLAVLLGMMRPGPHDRALIALPGRLRPLYYAVRPLRLLGRELGRLTGTARSVAGSDVAERSGTAQVPVPSLDVVVPCGRPDSAAATLGSLLACEGVGAVIVVGARLDGLRAAFPGGPFVWVETGRLLWPGANRNRGAARVGADIVAFVDDDVTVAPDFARKVRDRFLGRPGLSVLTGRARTRPSGYWARVYDLLNVPTGQADALVEGTRNFGIAFCMRRATYLEMEGCDENLRFGEDVDLASRVHARGLTTLCDPAIAVFHEHRRTDARNVLVHMFHDGIRKLVLERREAAAGSLKARLKLALRPVQPVAAPLFLALRVVRLAREAPLRLWLPCLAGVLAGVVAFETGRTLGWWRERLGGKRSGTEARPAR